MPRSIVLAVTSDEQYYRRICTALDGFLIQRPIHRDSGEEAILWIGANHCDLCIIDYDLPDMNGLDALIQMRQRRPGLQAIMTSGANSEAIAVAAFRQGIIDYIPRSQPDSHLELALQIREFLRTREGTGSPVHHRQAANVPAALREPTYQNRLRVIGRQLDRQGYRSANIVEVAGGFLVRAIARGTRAPQALEFPDHDFEHLIAGAFGARGEERWERATSPLLPTGYEDFLRALGYELDVRAAEAISIAEFDEIVVVGGVGQAEGSAASQLQPFHLIMRQAETEYTLNKAFRRRAAQPEQPRRTGIRRFI